MTALPEDMRERVIERTHEWIRDCGLDVRDVEAFIDREIMPVLEEIERQSIETLAHAQLNMRPLIALKNGNGDIDGKWYVMHWDDKNQVWNRARYADIVEEVAHKAREDEIKRIYIAYGTNRNAKFFHIPDGEKPLQRLEERLAELQSSTKESN